MRRASRRGLAAQAAPPPDHRLRRRRLAGLAAAIGLAPLLAGFSPVPVPSGAAPVSGITAAQAPVPAGKPSAPLGERVRPGQTGGSSDDQPRRGFFGLFGGGRDSAPASTTPATMAAATGGGSADQRALLNAYPGAFRIEGNAVVFPSGTRVPWDDGRRKSAAELLTDGDVEDMFHYPYPAGSSRPPGRDEDPGRVRSDAFFKALYGASEGAVRANLRAVPWVPKLGGGTLLVTTRFGVDEKLEAVSRDLERLPSRLHKYLVPPAGTFNWRAIAGTNRLSVHSYGAAIDINTKFTNYWRWDAQQAGGTIPYRNQIPAEIVAVFEQHCFVWGGRWYHYDTMHFEYRPELLRHCH